MQGSTKMDSPGNNEKPEFSLTELRKDSTLAEETKGIEFGVNPGNTSTKYLFWKQIFSAICDAFR